MTLVENLLTCDGCGKEIGRNGKVIGAFIELRCYSGWLPVWDKALHFHNRTCLKKWLGMKP